MFGTRWLPRPLACAVLGLAGLIAASGSASAVVLDPVNDGTIGGTQVQRVDLLAAGVPTINTIVLRDISGGVGGDPGVFSGYDLDAVFLDRDGSLATTGDQFAFTNLVFTGGSIRGGAGANQVPPQRPFSEKAPISARISAAGSMSRSRRSAPLMA